MPNETEDKPKTEAMKNFEANLDPLMLLVHRLEPQRVLRAVEATEREVEKWRQANFDDSGPLVDAMTRLSSTTKEFLSLRGLVYTWMSVMLVTFLEAYMEEGLISLASKNPMLLREAPPVTPDRALEVSSIEELRSELRQHWAQRVLRPGGPETWIKRLQRMGASGYENSVCVEVQHLWDTRNLILHSRSIATVAYARKYKASGVKSGTQLSVSNDRFGLWLEALKSFMDCTDAFFLKYKQPRMTAGQ